MTAPTSKWIGIVRRLVLGAAVLVGVCLGGSIALAAVGVHLPDPLAQSHTRKPAISATITAPPNGATVNASTYRSGCRGRGGLCGTIKTTARVTSVTVSIRSNATRRYWGVVKVKVQKSRAKAPTKVRWSFSASRQTYLAATHNAVKGGATWSYALPLPPDGGYTVHLLARDARGHAIRAAHPFTATFTVLTATPPAPTLGQYPPAQTQATSAAFAFSDGAAAVTFQCQLDGGAAATCASPVSYSGLAVGSHTFAVRAVDAAGNLSSASSYSWSVTAAASSATTPPVSAATPPPPPQITSGPGSDSATPDATFAFSDAQAGVDFDCQLDGGAWQSCASPITYYDLSPGDHAFGLRAWSSGLASSPATQGWTIEQPDTGVSFNISGDVNGSLYPGEDAGIALQLTNPNSDPIEVTSLTGEVSSTGVDGCDPSWFIVTMPTIPPGGITVPANGSLAPDGASVEMVDSGTSQNACEGATLTLAYSGEAHS